jgi:hypothetical protein
VIARQPKADSIFRADPGEPVDRDDVITARRLKLVVDRHLEPFTPDQIGQKAGCAARAAINWKSRAGRPPANLPDAEKLLRLRAWLPALDAELRQLEQRWRDLDPDFQRELIQAAQRASARLDHG